MLLKKSVIVASLFCCCFYAWPSGGVCVGHHMDKNINWLFHHENMSVK